LAYGKEKGVENVSLTGEKRKSRQRKGKKGEDLPLPHYFTEKEKGEKRGHFVQVAEKKGGHVVVPREGKRILFTETFEKKELKFRLRADPPFYKRGKKKRGRGLSFPPHCFQKGERKRGFRIIRRGEKGRDVWSSRTLEKEKKSIISRTASVAKRKEKGDFLRGG